MSDSHEELEFIKGILLGGVVGVTFALLFTPKTGKEIRENLWKIILRAKEESYPEIEEVQKKAEELLLEATRKLEEVKKVAGSAIAYAEEEEDAEEETLKGSPARQKPKTSKPRKRTRKSSR